MSQFLTAIDLGASSGRVVLGHLAHGRIHTTEVARFANEPVSVAEGGGEALHWDVLRLFHGIREGLRLAAREHGRPASIGIDTWAVDYGLLDVDGALLGNPYHYRDARTEGIVERVLDQVPAAELYRRTGMQIQPFNTIFQLAAAGGTPPLAAAHDLLLIPDLLGHWLTDARIAETTNASTTGLLDVASRQWSDWTITELERLIGAEVSHLLPALVEPGTVVAPVSSHVGAALGIEGTPWVAVGSHDTASAVAAVPMSTPGAAYISSGTWSLVGVELDAPVLSEASRTANFTNELGVAGTVRYLKNVAGLWLLQESLRTWAARGEPHDLAELLAAAADVPPLRCVVDVEDPAFIAPGDMPARIAAVAARSGQRPPEGQDGTPQGQASTVRCILDSLALGYRRALRQAAELSGREIDAVHIVGGGARNELLCQLTADATGLPVIAGPVEGTAVGNLLLQALAIGAIEGGLPEIRQIVASSFELRRWLPHAAEQTHWDDAERRLLQ